VEDCVSVLVVAVLVVLFLFCLWLFQGSQAAASFAEEKSRMMLRLACPVVLEMA